MSEPPDFTEAWINEALAAEPYDFDADHARITRVKMNLMEAAPDSVLMGEMHVLVRDPGDGSGAVQESVGLYASPYVFGEPLDGGPFNLSHWPFSPASAPPPVHESPILDGDDSWRTEAQNAFKAALEVFGSGRWGDFTGYIGALELELTRYKVEAAVQWDALAGLVRGAYTAVIVANHGGIELPSESIIWDAELAEEPFISTLPTLPDVFATPRDEAVEWTRLCISLWRALREAVQGGRYDPDAIFEKWNALVGRGMLPEWAAKAQARSTDHHVNEARETWRAARRVWMRYEAARDLRKRLALNDPDDGFTTTLAKRERAAAEYAGRFVEKTKGRLPSDDKMARVALCRVLLCTREDGTVGARETLPKGQAEISRRVAELLGSKDPGSLVRRDFAKWKNEHKASSAAPEEAWAERALLMYEVLLGSGIDALSEAA
jgi:hypothetical protein